MGVVAEFLGKQHPVCVNQRIVGQSGKNLVILYTCPSEDAPFVCVDQKTIGQCVSYFKVSIVYNDPSGHCLGLDTQQNNQRPGMDRCKESRQDEFMRCSCHFDSEPMKELSSPQRPVFGHINARVDVIST